VSGPRLSGEERPKKVDYAFDREDDGWQPPEWYGMSVAERYINGRGAIHLHVRKRLLGRNDAERGYLCIAYRLEGMDHADFRDGRRLPEIDLPASGKEHNARHMEVVVLVLVGRKRDHLQCVKVQSVRSVIRLYCVDDPRGIGRNPDETPLHTPIVDGLLPVGIDRELVRLARELMVDEDQPLNREVQGGTELIAELPEDYDPLTWGIWERLRSELVPSGLGVMLMDDLYRLRLGPRFPASLQVAEVFLGPLNLQGNAGERASHV